MRQEFDGELNSLFQLERTELEELSGAYIFVRENNGIAPTKTKQGLWTVDLKWTVDSSLPWSPKRKKFQNEQIDELIKKGLLGIVEKKLKLKDEDLKHEYWSHIIFDKFDSKFKPFLDYPLGIETYFELRYVAGHEEENIPFLMNSVISTYNELEKNYKGERRGKLLAAAISLTCRGKYQCPINMRRYIKLGGGISEVNKLGEMIGQKLEYNPEKRIMSYMNKIRENLRLSNLPVPSESSFLTLWELDKHIHPNVTGGYAASLAYFAIQIDSSGETKITQKNIANAAGSRIVDVQHNVGVILERQKDFLISRGVKVAPILTSEQKRIYGQLSGEFQEKLGLDYRPVITASVSNSPLQDRRLKLAIYLLENGYTTENPVGLHELTSALGFSLTLPSALHDIYSSEAGLAAKIGGIEYVRKGGGAFGIRDMCTTKKYIILMKKLIRSRTTQNP